jgi:hypothetical protein
MSCWSCSSCGSIGKSASCFPSRREKLIENGRRAEAGHGAKIPNPTNAGHSRDLGRFWRLRDEAFCTEGSDAVGRVDLAARKAPVFPFERQR